MFIFNKFCIVIKYLGFHFVLFELEMAVFTCSTISLKGYLLI